MKMFTILLIIISATATPVDAHPVSYQGATSLMSYNKPDQNELLLTYSFKSYLAAGLYYFKEGRTSYSLPRVNFLAKRWNNEDSQGNIYLSAGYGAERSFEETKGVGFASADLDWESRKYYTAASYSRFIRDSSGVQSRPDFEMIKLRAGVAPYLAEYNEINAWFILQAEKQNDSSTQLTQFVRLFYRNVLIELGAGFNGEWAFNYMVHF
ncbi:hypothetical protein B9G69_014630 [Bdellovibrio sp. SKB1291214]|uniref:hypothetical protein n=1 Tax=Bdellovibrio sp. SKB1291214 TaxID=1732569 RepID=UPI000B51E459|nr:hypothetical protein [Bdellovibrio sp. SKB1291214]UYL08277.1 hypothetical protein B9G69_014630 [Bdellovibrio sp. SKB1291214]